MDRITKHFFALGGIEDLMKGNVPSLEIRPSFEDLDLFYSSRIVLPRFIGVFQITKPIPETRKERENYLPLLFSEAVESIKNDITAKVILDLIDKGDNWHPRMICLGYCSKSFDQELIKNLYGEIPDRIRVVPYDKFPNFGSKNTAEFSAAFDELTRIIIGNDKDKNKRAVEIASSSYDELNKQLKTFGLTTEEYISMLSLRNIIEITPGDISEFLAYMEKNWREIWNRKYRRR